MLMKEAIKRMTTAERLQLQASDCRTRVEVVTTRDNQKETYTDLFGDVIQVESLLWLEDGRYYDEEQGEYCNCARYCTNAEEKDADGESVWLNDDFVEVDLDAYPEEDDEDEGEEDDEGEEVDE